MRRIYLLFGIVGLLFVSPKLNAQWDKMPVGTKLCYNYQYSIFKYNLNETEDTINSEPMVKDIRIDTIITLSGKDRKVVLFSEVLDPYGSANFKIPNEFDDITDYDLFDKDKCSLFYYFKDAVYAIEVSKHIRRLLQNAKIIKDLDDSLSKAIYYSTTTDTLLNYWAKEKKEQFKAQFTIQGYSFVFQPFKLLKGEKYKKISDVYTLGNDPYSDFYGVKHKENDSTDLYIYASGKWNAKILYSPKDGIISSDAFAGRGANEIDLKMKLQKIEYPNSK